MSERRLANCSSGCCCSTNLTWVHALSALLRHFNSRAWEIPRALPAMWLQVPSFHHNRDHHIRATGTTWRTQTDCSLAFPINQMNTRCHSHGLQGGLPQPRIQDEAESEGNPCCATCQNPALDWTTSREVRDSGSIERTAWDRSSYPCFSLLRESIQVTSSPDISGPVSAFERKHDGTPMPTRLGDLASGSRCQDLQTDLPYRPLHLRVRISRPRIQGQTMP